MASIVEGFNYDIFISYRQKDNKYDGWVTEFVDNLKRELESIFKNEVSFVSRVKIPTLMLNGRFDYRYPPNTNLKPFFDLLGTPEKDKRLCIYETDHYVTKSDMIKEVLAWCDKYMGTVK